MAEYIDRDAVLAIVDFPRFARKAIEELPTADVQPVRRGRWMYLYDENYRCSECGEDFALIDGTGFLGLLNYCPNCGAKMDGDGDV